MIISILINDLVHYHEIYDHFGDKNYCCVEDILYESSTEQYYLLINFYQTSNLNIYLEGFEYQLLHKMPSFYTPFGINQNNTEIISEREYIQLNSVR